MSGSGRAALVLVGVLALGASACGSRLDPETPAPTTGPSTSVPAPPDGPTPDGGEALSVEEALDVADGSEVTVIGALYAEGDDVRLCSALAESFPPQCGGATLAVEGLDLSEYELEEEQGVRWSDEPVEVSGTVAGGVLTVG